MEKEITKYLQSNKDSEYYKDKPGVFHASSCGLCPRLIFLSRIKPTEETIDTKKIYLIGDIFHKFCEENLFKGYQTEQKIEYDNSEFKIIGKVDAYNETEVIDFKTCKDTKYLYEPKIENVIQLNVYMKILGLNTGRLIYIGKQDFKIKEFHISYDESMFKETEAKLRFINNKLKENASFEEINIEPSQLCFWCKYKGLCFPKQY